MNPRLERLGERLLLAMTLVCVVITVALLGFMLALALPLIRSGHFPGLLAQPWDPRAGAYGVLPMLLGTLAIAALATVIAFPLSLGMAGLIGGLAPRRWRACLRACVQVMTGVPSVIYGFVGVLLLAPLIRQLFAGGSGLCILTAALMLALLIAPTMILFVVDSFERVPDTFLHAAEAAGATPVQRLLLVVIPASRRGILTGLILGLARAFGDTLIALMLAGNAAIIPYSPLGPARSLTSHIALVTAADVNSLEFRSIFVCGLLLYLLITVLVLAIRQLGAGGWRPVS